MALEGCVPFPFSKCYCSVSFLFFVFLRGVNLKTLSKLIMLRHRIGNQELKSHVVSKNFMPFGGGMRQCAGAEYSRVFLATFFHVLLTKYRYIFCLHSSHFKRLNVLVSNIIAYDYYFSCVLYRWENIKIGNISRNPILGFGKGIHIKFSHK